MRLLNITLLLIMGILPALAQQPCGDGTLNALEQCETSADCSQTCSCSNGFDCPSGYICENNFCKAPQMPEQPKQTLSPPQQSWYHEILAWFLLLWNNAD